MAGGIGQHEDLFVSFIGTIHEHYGPKSARTFDVTRQLVARIDDELKMQLHRNVWRRPGGLGEGIDTLHGQPDSSRRVDEFDPLRLTVGNVGVMVKAQQFAVEDCDVSYVDGVDGGVQ